MKQVSKLDLQRKIKDLSPTELDRYVDGIERAEGKFKPGRIIKESPRGSLKKKPLNLHLLARLMPSSPYPNLVLHIYARALIEPAPTI